MEVVGFGQLGAVIVPTVVQLGFVVGGLDRALASPCHHMGPSCREDCPLCVGTRGADIELLRVIPHR